MSKGVIVLKPEDVVSDRLYPYPHSLQSAQPSALFVYVAKAKQHTHMLLYATRNGGSIG